VRPETVTEAVAPDDTAELHESSVLMKDAETLFVSTHSDTVEAESETAPFSTTVVEPFHAPVERLVVPSDLYCVSEDGALGAVASMPTSVAAVTVSEFPP